MKSFRERKRKEKDHGLKKSVQSVLKNKNKSSKKKKKKRRRRRRKRKG